MKFRKIIKQGNKMFREGIGKVTEGVEDCCGAERQKCRR